MQKVIILTGPSGVGKNTLGDLMLEHFPDLSYSVSATTRPIRKGEEHGRDYHFISTEEFENKIRNEEVLEWQEVYDGLYYGTLKSELTRINALDKFPLLVIDVFGALNIMKNLKFKPLTLFIRPASLEVLRERLERRGTEAPEKIDARLEKARVELEEAGQFDIAVINDDLSVARDQLAAIIKFFLQHGN